MSKNVITYSTKSGFLTSSLFYDFPFFYNNYQGNYYRYEATIINYSTESLIKKRALT